jgi:hypothetical protein
MDFPIQNRLKFHTAGAGLRVAEIQWGHLEGHTKIVANSWPVRNKKEIQVLQPYINLLNMYLRYTVPVLIT